MLVARLREAHSGCNEHLDIATASLIGVWIDETERANMVPVRGDALRRSHRSLLGRFLALVEQRVNILDHAAHVRRQCMFTPGH